MILRLAKNSFALATLALGTAMGAQPAIRDCKTTACAPNESLLTARLDSLRKTHGIPGLAVVVLHDTTVVFASAFGFADIANRTLVTTETPFNIASVSKPISAVVALRLVQDRLLDLDAPMQNFRGFAEFCTSAREGGGIFFRDYLCDGNALTLRHVLSMSANGVPGTRFWYNPPSYSWASRPMLEKTGVAFSTLVDSLIFRVAHMQHSARINRALPLRADLAVTLALPYHFDSTTKAFVQSEQPDPQGDGAAGGVITTAMDLARFDIALTNGRLINDALRKVMWTGTKTPSGDILPYGLGWFLGDYRGRRVAWHTGLWEGQYSALYLKVLGDKSSERFTFILLANSDGLQWSSQLNEATIERSPFATMLMNTFGAGKK
ncbi:MAG: serine hydrolase domain-containing protein [Gemmatimonadaceae bacterium]